MEIRILRIASQLILALTLGVQACPQPSDQIAIPFRFSKNFGLMLVTSEINGKPAVLILDTGSNHTSVSSKLADRATLSLKDAVTTARGSGFTGTGVYTKATLKIGRLVWLNHTVLALEMEDLSKTLGENIDGILGMDFLSGYKTVIVDLSQHKLILVASSDPVSNGRDSAGNSV